jgi:hypothetical protein
LPWEHRRVRDRIEVFASKESVVSDAKSPRESPNNAELDRQAWNLPSPRPQPAGPVRDVWPVRPVPMQDAEERLLEDPAAA